MKKAVEENVIEGFEIGGKKVLVTHSQFADDSIFFLKNKEDTIDNLKWIFKAFTLVSGLKINMGKSEVMGLNIEEERLNQIADLLGCSCGKWPLNYLGLSPWW